MDCQEATGTMQDWEVTPQHPSNDPRGRGISWPVLLSLPARCHFARPGCQRSRKRPILGSMGKEKNGMAGGFSDFFCVPTYYDDRT